jgi:hypothetical protein
MRRRSYRVVLVCTIVLAGCSGFGGSGPAGSGGEGEGSGEAVASVTPAPVPAAETPERLAPGLTSDGVANASALFAADSVVLRNRSFGVRTNRTIEYTNGTVRERTVGTVRVGPGGRNYSVRYEFRERPSPSNPDGPGVAWLGYYSGGERTLRALGFANGTTRYESVSTQVGASIQRSITRPGREYERLLEASETRVLDRSIRNGTSLYVLETSEIPPQYLGFYSGFEDSRNATLRVLVDERGLIRRHRLAYTARTEANVTVRVSETVRYTDLGATIVVRPPWYDDALRATNGTDSTTASAAIDSTTGGEA